MLRDVLQSPDGKRRFVRRVFATIAARYDFITAFLSYGQDRRWKRRVADLAQVRHGMCAVDLACGTGDIAFELRRRGARVVGLDITAGMLALARRRVDGGEPAFAMIAGDMQAIPLRDASADVVTTGYGLRNVTDLPGAIREIRRILRPGGRLVSLDFNRPESAIVRTAYLTYLRAVGGALGKILHGDPDTYRYIPESLRLYPGARGVACLLADAGFEAVDIIPVLGGLMTIHVARRALP